MGGGITIQAQDNSRMVFTRYGLEEGLQNVSIKVLGQDSEGYIWLADPLTRFDGHVFKPYAKDRANESSGWITATSMTDDGNGLLFFAGKDGVYFYDKNRDDVIRIPSIPLNNPSRAIIAGQPNEFWDINMAFMTRIRLPGFDTTTFLIDSLRSPERFAYVKGRKDLWKVSESKGIQRMDVSTRRILPVGFPDSAKLHHQRLITDSDGRLWLMTNHELWRLDETSNSFVLIYSLPETSPSRKGVTSNYFGLCGKNCWWFVDYTGASIFRLDLATLRMQTYPLPSTTKFDAQVFTNYPAIETQDGSLLLGTANEGIYLIHPLKGIVHQYLPGADNPKSLASAYAIPQFQTGENTFWICGMGQGLIKAENIRPLFPKLIPGVAQYHSGYKDNIRSLIEWRGQLVVGTIDAVSILQRDGTFKPLPMPGNLRPPVSQYGMAALAKDRSENLLVLYWNPDIKNTLYYFDYRNERIQNLTTYFPQITFESSLCLFNDSGDDFWISAQRGVIRIPAAVLESGQFAGRPDQYRFYSFAEFHQISVDVHTTFAITEGPDHAIWVGTNTGVIRINSKDHSMQHFESLPGETESLSHNNVRSIVVARDQRVWIGTAGGGLNLYDPEHQSFRHFSIQDGLPDNVIYTLAEDDHGLLWLGTNKGLCRFDPVNRRTRNFTPADGIQNFEFNTNAVCKLSNGFLAFGGIDGFNLFHPDSVMTHSRPPPVVITNFKVRDKEFPLGSDRVSLTYAQNFLTFEFSALEYFQNEKNQYAYMLEDVDADWVNAGNRRFVSYPGLKPGRYVFRVRAANSDGVWNQEGITKFIDIRPPWWGTWWFRAFVFVVISSGIYAFYRYRLQQALKLQHLRNRIATDLHDEIGSTLSSISLAGSVIQKKLHGATPEVESLISRISENTDNMMEAMSDIVWAVNTKNDRFDNVINRMRAFAIERLEPLGIPVHFRESGDIHRLQLDMQQRKNLYLIFKEAVNNAAKYAACKNVWVDISILHSTMTIKISDDGRGFELTSTGNGTAAQVPGAVTEQTLGGNGLHNMQKRAMELKGTLHVESGPGKGTAIEIRFTV